MGKMLERVARRFGVWMIYLYIKEDEDHVLCYEVWTREGLDPAYSLYIGYDYCFAVSMFELQMHRAADAAIRDFNAEFKKAVSQADQKAMGEIEEVQKCQN